MLHVFCMDFSQVAPGRSFQFGFAVSGAIVHEIIHGTSLEGRLGGWKYIPVMRS